MTRKITIITKHKEENDHLCVTCNLNIAVKWNENCLTLLLYVVLDRIFRGNEEQTRINGNMGETIFMNISAQNWLTATTRKKK